MKKSSIGLILLVIGVIIVLVSFAQTNLLNAGSLGICYLGVTVGGIVGLLGIYILWARFLKWSFK